MCEMAQEELSLSKCSDPQLHPLFFPNQFPHVFLLYSGHVYPNSPPQGMYVATRPNPGQSPDRGLYCWFYILHAAVDLDIC